jgi:K+-transporting ATPase ATPase A chain
MESLPADPLNGIDIAAHQGTPILAAAGSLAAKRRIAVSAGTFPTHNGLFVSLLVAVVVVVSALTFFPALALGPIVEHFLMQAGHTFAEFIVCL